LRPRFLPKDIRAFIASAADLEVGEALGFLREVDAVNMRRRSRAADLVGGEVAGVSDGGSAQGFIFFSNWGV
jgi:hypothetical protein